MDALELALKRSSDATKLDYVDVLFLHSNICPDGYVYAHNADIQDRFATTWSIYVDHFIPAMEALKQKGRIGAWGITGTGIPDTIINALSHDVKPAVVQAVANLMDSAGGMRRYAEPARPREIIAAARKNDVGVLGIRAVQAGALCAELVGGCTMIYRSLCVALVGFVATPALAHHDAGGRSSRHAARRATSAARGELRPGARRQVRPRARSLRRHR